MASKFINFVNQTGSPYHTVSVAKKSLIDRGFKELREGTKWCLELGGKYVVTRNGSDIFAFIVGNKFDPKSEKGGFVCVGAHTDSPCLRLRPKSKVAPVGSYLQIGVHVYGGGLWHTWFDRELGLAGKVMCREGNGIVEKLIRVAKPVCVIPNLAIHLQSAEERKAFQVNPENHLMPVLLTDAKNNKTEGKHPNQLLDLIAKELNVKSEDIIDMDICLFDTQPGQLSGINDDFVSTARIDNLASTWACVEGLADFDPSESHDVSVAVAFDHEEVGSVSYVGANSNAMETWLKWIHESLNTTLGKTDAGENDYNRMIQRSFLFSADGVHGLHPNYAGKHQAEHRPDLNGGVVIKTNPNQRYATNCTGSSVVREIGTRSNVQVQDICVKNDSPCGSTIGPALSSVLGVRTVDLGIPQLAMHSCREICGAHDLEELRKLCVGLWTHFRDIDEKISKI